MTIRELIVRLEKIAAEQHLGLDMQVRDMEVDEIREVVLVEAFTFNGKTRPPYVKVQA